MKKLGDLMKELGFKPHASQGAQEAFLENLIREAYGAEAPTSKEQKAIRQKTRAKKIEQLSFDLPDLVADEEISATKKRIGTGTR